MTPGLRAQRRMIRFAYALAVMAAVLGALWIASLQVWADSTGSPFYFQCGLRRGCVFARWFPALPDGSRSGFGNPGFHASATTTPGVDPWFSWRFGGTMNEIRAPLWPFAIIAAAGSVAAFRRARTLRDPWVCARCHYDLGGVTSTECPECGTPRDPAPAPTA